MTKSRSLQEWSHQRPQEAAEAAVSLRRGHQLPQGPREEAKAFSTDREKAAEADCLFATLLAALPAALRQRDTDGVIAQLERLHLQPLAAQTVEHMLCEYRKILAPGGRTRGGSRTTAADYAALWAAAAPLYARRAA